MLEKYFGGPIINIEVVPFSNLIIHTVTLY